MTCLIQLLFYEAHDGKRTLDCKGKDCLWYGGQDCYAAKRDKDWQTTERDGKDGNDG